MPRNRQEEEPRVSEIKDKIEAGVEHHRPFVADAELTLAFLTGNQWVASSQTRGITPVENKTGELRDVDNQMLNHFRRWNHFLFQEDPVMTAFEGGRELADAERAKVAASLCDYWENNNGFREARKEVAQWTGICGIGYLVPSWRKNLRHVKRRTLEYVEEGEETATGQIRFVKEEEVNDTRSDLLFESYNPLQVYPFPLTAQKWDRVEGILTVDLATYSWIRDHVDADITEDELEAVDAREVNGEALDRLNRYVSPEFGLMPETSADESLYIVAQWLERPSTDHPDGRYQVMVGGQIHKDTKLPFVEEARSIDPMDRLNITMGFIPFWPMDFPGKLIPPAPFGSDLRKAQVRLNDILTDMRRNRKTVGRSKLIYEEGTLDEDAWTDEHGEKIPVKKGTQTPPQVTQGQPLNGLDYEMSYAANAFEQQSGQTDAIKGQNPTQVRAAFHLEMLREDAMTLMYQTIDKHEESYEVAAKFALEIARRRYPVERIIEIYGRDYAGHALTYATAKIDTDVRVRPGSMKPRNKAVKEAKLKEIMEAGGFEGRMDDFWEMSELGTMNRAVNHEQKHRLRAQAENVLMLQYEEIVDVFEHERHDLHIEEHAGYMARPEWYNADDVVKQMTLTHLQMHRQMEIANVAPEAQRSPEPVAGLASGAGIPAAGGKGGAGAASGQGGGGQADGQQRRQGQGRGRQPAAAQAGAQAEDANNNTT